MATSQSMMEPLKRSAEGGDMGAKRASEEGFTERQLSQLKLIMSGTKDQIVGELGERIGGVETVVGQLGERVGNVESSMSEVYTRLDEQGTFNADLVRRIEALEVGSGPRTMSGKGGSVSKLDLFIKILRDLGDAGSSDKKIENAVMEVVGQFESVGCKVDGHVHPRRTSKARYWHMIMLKFTGVAEKAHFWAKWTDFNADTRKVTCTLKVKGVDTLIGEPLSPEFAAMLGELISEKDKLVATTGVDGESLKFDLLKGTIKDISGTVLYQSPKAKN